VHHILGYAPEDLVATDLTFLVHPEEREVVASSIAAIAGRPGTTVTYQARLAHIDGSWRWFEITSGNRIDDPSVAGIVSNSYDITETRKVQDRLIYEATHDVLTGLANRALFNDSLQCGVTHGEAGYRMGVVLVDLDDFKTVNDSLGHAVGDGLLVAVADTLRRMVRPGDTVARLGGDEFAILLDSADHGVINQILGRITAEMVRPITIDGHQLTARASFGVVEARPGDDPQTLMRHADFAMYKAKERGEGGFEHFRAGMRAGGTERRRTTEALPCA
jgi:diguanylate cyclase (GGDEF)-like protein/PAS domain S-box-containing protein